jgi:hypothetical protein
MAFQSKFYNQLNFEILINKISYNSAKWNKIPSREAYGNFELLLDEELAGVDTSNRHKYEKQQNQNNLPKWK